MIDQFYLNEMLFYTENTVKIKPSASEMETHEYGVMEQKRSAVWIRNKPLFIRVLSVDSASSTGAPFSVQAFRLY